MQRPGLGSAVQPPAPVRTAPVARPPWRSRLARDWPLLAMVAPAILLLWVFHYIPMLGNVAAFQEYSPYLGFQESPFVGLSNFARLLGDPDAWNAVLNTLTITALQIVVYFPVTIALALLLHGILNQRLRALIQSIVYLPHFLSWVIVVALFQQMLGGAGFLNHTMLQHGFGPVDVMTDPSLFKVLVTVQVIWKDAGWGAIIFLAALATINMDLYEAAAVDGAGRWRRLWHITLPGLRPVIVLLLILRLGDALTVGFEQILLQRDAVGAGAAEVIDTYVYFTGVIAGDWGYATAAGLVKGLVGLVLVLAANKIAHVLGEDGLFSWSRR